VWMLVCSLDMQQEQGQLQIFIFSE